MATEKKSLIYEPPFGLGVVGFQRTQEDDVMPEILLEWVPMSEEMKKELTIRREQGGLVDIPQDVLVSRESKEIANLRFALFEFVMRQLIVNEGSFPNVQNVYSSYSTAMLSVRNSKESPIGISFLPSTTTQTEQLIGDSITYNQLTFTFNRHPQATRSQYIRGRNIVLDHANRLFDQVGISVIPELPSLEAIESSSESK